MKPEILYSTEPPVPFKLSEVKCPFCGGSDVEDIFYELAGNPLFDAETQKLYRCNGKRWHVFKRYLGEWDGKRHYKKDNREYIDCCTEFLITKTKKEAKRNGGISFL